MSVYEIRRYGRFIASVTGDEADLSEWLRENVLPSDEKVAIRSVRTAPWRLFSDARKRKYEIMKK